MAQEQLELSARDNALAIQEGDSTDLEFVLELYRGYITQQVEKLAGHYSNMSCTSMLDKDDIVQLVLIKFWQALKKKSIAHPGAYIKRMIYNEFVNMLRGCKPALPLSDEEEEVQEGNTICIPCEEKDLPEFQVEQEDTAIRYAKRAAKAIGTLPPRQKRAMECFLHERMDDPRQFKETFKVYRVNVEDARLPTTKAEKQLLNASLSAARKHIAIRMNIDLKLYKQKGAAYLAR